MQGGEVGVGKSGPGSNFLCVGGAEGEVRKP